MSSGNPGPRGDEPTPIRHGWWGGRRSRTAGDETRESTAPAGDVPPDAVAPPVDVVPTVPTTGGPAPLSVAAQPAGAPAEDRRGAGRRAAAEPATAAGAWAALPYRYANAGGSTEDQLTRLVIDMRQAIPELTGVMIASEDGLSLCHDFPDAESDRIAAMAATASGLGKRISERTSLGVMQETVVRGDDGYLVVYAAGRSAVLVLAGPKNSNLGLMRIEARAASAHIGQILP